MARYVVDTSVVAEYLISGNFTNYAEMLFERTSNAAFVVPEFCLLEATNVLWKHVRFQGMPLMQAKLLLRDLKAMPLKRAAVKSLLGHAMQIAVTHKLAVYDSMYIALAKRTDTPLITLDQPQERAAMAEGVVVKPITDFI
jgi:predicted nucleic acid-binding protein